jgi:hypothetical protein
VRRTLGWAIYLAASWTWCIGMFLPVLLIRDYGVWGWVVFAVPNVIGAAAMGWTVRSPAQSRALSEAHRTALSAFSFVTATFQIFFAAWFFRRAGADRAELFILSTAGLAVLAFGYPILRNRRVAPALSVAAYLASMACIVGAFGTGALRDSLYMAADLRHPYTLDLPLLAPVIVFGFLLCPYLDRTFHHARQHLPGPADGKAAFGFGFVVLFLVMIFFTLAYALAVYFAMLNPRMGAAPVLWWVACHMAVQLAFTMAVHWIGGDDDDDDGPQLETDRAGHDRADLAYGRVFFFAFATAAVGVVAALATRWIHHDAYEGGEIVYRLFMSFYGLVFPAYAWLCMLPTWRHPAPPSRRARAVFATAVFVAAPMYYLALIEDRMVWLIPGLLVVLLARLAGSGSTSPRDHSPSPPPA